MALIGHILYRTTELSLIKGLFHSLGIGRAKKVLASMPEFQKPATAFVSKTS